MAPAYSPIHEAQRIFDVLCDQGDRLGLPDAIRSIRDSVSIESDYDRVYFPVPFKETETVAALKAVEGAVASALLEIKYGRAIGTVKVDLERATRFACQTYIATVDGLGKLDKGVRAKLKGELNESG
jgi:hypothetical protein